MARTSGVKSLPPPPCFTAQWCRPTAAFGSRQRGRSARSLRVRFGSHPYLRYRVADSYGGKNQRNERKSLTCPPIAENSSTFCGTIRASFVSRWGLPFLTARKHGASPINLANRPSCREIVCRRTESYRSCSRHSRKKQLPIQLAVIPGKYYQA